MEWFGVVWSGLKWFEVVRGLKWFGLDWFEMARSALKRFEVV